MEKDFYIDEQWLASYFEKDWFDHVLRESNQKPIGLSYPQFDLSLLYSDYHEKLAAFLSHHATGLNFNPKELCEVGSSLGRTFYEMCIRFKELKCATLIEPSLNLATTFKKIFEGEPNQAFPVLTGNFGIGQISFETSQIRERCSKVKTTLLNLPFNEVQKSPHSFDLVVCSNVIDQCENPLALVDFLKASTRPGGLVLLSCTYQWKKEYRENEIKNINDLFAEGWNHINETNISFKARRNERFWVTFLCHVSLFQKL